MNTHTHTHTHTHTLPHTNKRSHKQIYTHTPQWHFSKHINSPKSFIHFHCVLSHTKESPSQHLPPYRAQLHTLYLSFHSISISLSCYSGYIFNRHIESVYIHSPIKIWLVCTAHESLNMSSRDTVQHVRIIICTFFAIYIKTWNWGCELTD